MIAEGDVVWNLLSYLPHFVCPFLVHQSRRQNAEKYDYCNGATNE
jgi:hypothetical protein